MDKQVRVLLLFLLLPILTASSAAAQGFGKNKVHYSNFDWTVIKTEHFEVYFYGGERQTALDAARMAERSYKRISKSLNHEIEHPVPVIVYASHTDFQQTNITEGLIDEGTGGITELFKQRVFLPFTGSYAELEHVLTHELVHAFEMDIVFSDGLGFVQNPLGFQPPLWLMEGLAEYISLGGVDPHTRMWLRDAALEGYLIPISTLSMVHDIRVYRFGQSLCDYIARHYGEEKLGDLLRRVPESRDLNDAFNEVVGVPADRLSDLWLEEIRRTYLPEIANHEKPDDFATRLTEQGNDMSRLNLAPAISPKGDRLVFISDRSLYQDIYLASAIDGKILDRLVKGERSGDLESLRYLSASLTWSPDETRIAAAAKAGAKDVIYIFDVAQKKVVGKIRVDLDGLQSPAWSPDGERIAFVGLEGGQSDLFVCKVDGSELRRLTRDRYMDRDPAWSPDGTRIAFTTDRGEGTDFDALVFADSRVGVYTLADGSIEMLPGQEGKNVDPCWSPDGSHIAFISNRTGVSNIFAVDLAAGAVYQLTDVLSGITGIMAQSPALSWSAEGDRMVFCAFNKGGYDIYAVKNPLELKKSYVPVPAEKPDDAIAQTDPATLEAPTVLVTPDVVGVEAAGVDEGMADTGADTGMVEAGMADSVVADAGALANPDGESTPTDTVAVGGIPAEAIPAAIMVTQPNPVLVDVGDAIDLDKDRTADAENADEESEGTTAADDQATLASLPDTSAFHIAPYKTRFTRDFTVGGAAFASNVGFAGQTALSFSDILGNHNIFVAASVFGSLSDSDLLVSYTNRRNRINYGLALFQYRNDYLVHTAGADENLESRVYRGVELAFSRPFSKFSRLEWAMQASSVSESVYRSWYYGRPADVEEMGTLYFWSPSLALVTDNVVFGYNGPLSGTRSRFEVAHSFGDLISTTGLVDWRHYTNLRQRYIIGARVIGALSDGRDAEVFRVGGPFTFRGSDWGTLVGSRILISNLEFRYPLIDHLAIVWPLALDFRGIQGVLFFDTATVWSSGRVRLWSEGHLHDIRAAYGFGARLNLGIMNLRYDMAQATDLSRQIGDVRHFFTIGYDF